MFSQNKIGYKEECSLNIQNLLLASPDDADDFVSKHDTTLSMLVLRWLPTLQQYLLVNFLPTLPSSHGYFFNDLGITKDSVIHSKKMFVSENAFNEFYTATTTLFRNTGMLFHLHTLGITLGKIRDNWSIDTKNAFELIHKLRGRQLVLAGHFAQNVKRQTCIIITKKSIGDVEALHAELRNNFNEEQKEKQYSDSGINDNRLSEEDTAELKNAVEKTVKNLLEPALANKNLGEFEENLIDGVITQEFIDDANKATDALKFIVHYQDTYNYLSWISPAAIKALPDFLMDMLLEGVNLIQSPIGQTRELLKNVLFSKMLEKNNLNGHPLLEPYLINYLITDTFLQTLKHLPNVLGFDQSRKLPDDLLQANAAQLKEGFFLLAGGESIEGHNFTFHSLPASTGIPLPHTLYYYLFIAIIGTLITKCLLDKALFPLLAPWGRAIGTWMPNRHPTVSITAEQQRLLREDELQTVVIDTGTPDTEIKPSSTLRRRRHSEPSIPSVRKNSFFVSPSNKGKVKEPTASTQLRR